jgi:peptidoglycan/LPS O-acetylase OafA/YrhL
MRNSQEPAEPSLLHTMRQLLLVLVTAGMLGTAADLLLLEHFENAWQLPPLVLIGIALLVVAWLFISGGAVAVMAMRVMMICFVAAGCVGILLHYNGNSEFQREIDPTLQGWALVVKVMTAKAPPALAPASMIQLGLLGLLYTYRHPSLQWLVHGEALKGSRP